MGMFDFLNMANDFEERKLDRLEVGDLLVSTVRVFDSAQPYETAVAHPAYNGGDIVVVEMYDSLAEAQDGHDRWAKIMTAEVLPESLSDVSTSEIKIGLFGKKPTVFKRK